MLVIGCQFLLINSIGLFRVQTLNTPSWSIGAEWICYLLYSLFFIRQHLKSNCGNLFLAISTITYLLLHFDPKLADISTGAIRGLLGFGVGVNLLRFVKESSHRWRSARIQANFATVIALIFGLALICLFNPYSSLGIYIFSSGLLFLCVLNNDTKYFYPLNYLGKSWFGKISYGMYLWIRLYCGSQTGF